MNLEDALILLVNNAEQKIMSACITAPQTVPAITGSWRPKVNQAAVTFWREFENIQPAILSVELDTAATMCVEIVCRYDLVRDYVKGLCYELDSQTAEDAVRKALDDLHKLRTGWQALKIVQQEAQHAER